MSRVYICHTIYHALIATLKELELVEKNPDIDKVDLIISTMSNDFKGFPGRAEKCGLWNEVFLFDEKEDFNFPEVMKYHNDRGNVISNMLARIKYTRLLGLAQENAVPVDLKKYTDVYVFCDSDPIGYYLNAKHIRYHAIEDGLDTVYYCDDALYSNLGHLKLKLWMAEKGLIHIPDGYAKYCIDMEVNNAQILDTPCKKYKEVPRKKLYERLTDSEKEFLLELFVEDTEKLKDILKNSTTYGTADTVNTSGTADTVSTSGSVGTDNSVPIVLILSDPLCSLEVREQIFKDIISEYGYINGKKAKVVIKPHPRDLLDYAALFKEETVLPGSFPMEMLNFLPRVHFNRVVTVFTVPDAILFADEKVFLGPEFMDKYEAHELHNQNEKIKESITK